MKSFQVSLDIEEEENLEEDVEIINRTSVSPPVVNIVSGIRKVQCDISPYFYTFFNHTPCYIVIDTGATSSVVSRTFLKAAGIPVQPTHHSARSADKSLLHIRGEAKFTLNFGSMDLPITAIVIDSLDCDVLAGIPFCKENDVQVHLKEVLITINSLCIPYGSKDNTLNLTLKCILFPNNHSVVMSI